MMQAYAEGFGIMQAKREFDLDFAQIAQGWRYDSVVRSWLLDLAAERLHDGHIFVRQALHLCGRHVLTRYKDILVESHRRCVSSRELHWERGYTRTRNARKPPASSLDSLCRRALIAIR